MPAKKTATTGVKTSRSAAKKTVAKTTPKSGSRSTKKPIHRKKITRTKKSSPVQNIPYQTISSLADKQDLTLPQLPSLMIDQKSNRYWNWLIGFTAVALGVLIITGLLSIFSNRQTTKLTNQQRDDQKQTDTATKPVFTALAPLTGLATDDVSAKRRPWAVVIENFPSIRPQQSGLSFADLVIESPTEGGITRFVAIFQSQLPTGLIGPIRSARSYFNDWIRPFSPFFSHSGGSTKALQQLARGYGDIQDVNEFYNAAAYQRLSTQTAPHNLFTSAEKFFSYVQQKNWSWQQEIKSLPFSQENTPGQPATKIMIPYQPEEYLVTYEYSPDKQAYQRSLMGVKQTDAINNQPILVTNAIILSTDIDPIPNDELKRTELKTLGQGVAWLLNRGQVYKGLWHKDKPDSYLTFTNENGQPLPLTPGNTWISVIDSALLKDIKIEALGEPLNLE